MATINVSLPDPMRKWVETQVSSGEYANASDYVRDLIRQDHGRPATVGPSDRSYPDGLPALGP